MDGYGEVFLKVAGIVALCAFTAGLITRYHLVAVIAVITTGTFFGVFGDLYLWHYVPAAGGASIAVITTAFVFPLLCIAAVVGRGITRLVQRKV